MMPSLLLLFALVLGLFLITVSRGSLLMPLILGLLVVLVITPWFVVSPGQIAPIPVVTAIPITVTPASPGALPEMPSPISNPGDLSLNGIPPTDTGR